MPVYVATGVQLRRWPRRNAGLRGGAKEYIAQVGPLEQDAWPPFHLGLARDEHVRPVGDI